METTTVNKLTLKSKNKIQNDFEKLLENGDLDLEFKINLPLETVEKSSTSYIEEYHFNIIYTSHHKDFHPFKQGYRKKIGEGKLKIFNAESASNNQECPVDIFDSSDEDAHIYTNFYTHGTFDFDEELFEINKIDDIMGYNLAYLDRIKLNEKYRGKGIGAFVLRNICEWLTAKAAFIAFKSFPIQYEGKFSEDNFSENDFEKYKSEQKKLDDYYSKIGFKKLILKKDHSKKDDSYFYYNPSLKNVIGLPFQKFVKQKPQNL